MINLIYILESVLLAESASIDNVNDAIDKKYRVIINYHSKGEDVATGARMIEVYAYGLTKAGNPVIRAFQPYGDTTSKVPSWKFFRLDRISDWKPTKQKFTEPASDYYPNLGMFNKNGDSTMSVVYNIAKFGNEPNIDTKIPQTPSPKKKDDSIYKTDTERNMNRLQQQLDNPVYVSDLKTKNSFDDLDKKNDNSKNLPGAKVKDNIPSKSEIKPNNVNQVFTNDKNVNNLYKTDTEQNMEKLKQQINNPQYIDQSVLDRYNKEKNNRLNRNKYGK